MINLHYRCIYNTLKASTHNTLRGMIRLSVRILESNGRKCGMILEKGGGEGEKCGGTKHLQSKDYCIEERKRIL